MYGINRFAENRMLDSAEQKQLNQELEDLASKYVRFLESSMYKKLPKVVRYPLKHLGTVIKKKNSNQKIRSTCYMLEKVMEFYGVPSGIVCPDW